MADVGSSKKTGKRKNINFEISLLKAKVGEEPKIKRCALVAKHGKKSDDLDREKIEAELEKLALLKREGVAHHEKRVLRKVIKEGVRPEVQKLSKRLKVFQFSLDKLRGQGEAAPEKVIAEKQANVAKLESQLATLKHLDLDIAASIAWQVLDSGLNPEQVAATLLADDIKNQDAEGKVLHQQRAAYVRAVKAAAVAAKVEEMRRQRAAREAKKDGEGDVSLDMESSSSLDEESEGNSDNDARARKEKGRRKALDILAKLGAARQERQKTGADSEELAESSDDDDADESDSPMESNDEEDALDHLDGVDYDDDLFLGSLKASDSGEKKRGRQKGVEKKGPPKKKERKNRLGQQARRALAEKIHGKNAKHLKQEANNRGGPGQPSAQKKTGDFRARSQGGNTRDKRFTNDKDNTRNGSRTNWQATDANRTPLGPSPSQQSKPKGDEKLHPSWEASQKRKQQESAIQAFQGKKLKLSDD